jgi:hypothetical protein
MERVKSRRKTLPGIQTLSTWSCAVGWTMTHGLADLLLQQTHVVYGIILQTEFWTRRGRCTIPGFPIDKAPGQRAPHSGANGTRPHGALLSGLNTTQYTLPLGGGTAPAADGEENTARQGEMSENKVGKIFGHLKGQVKQVRE